MNKHLALDRVFVDGTATVVGYIKIEGAGNHPMVLAKGEGTSVDVKILSQPICQAEGKRQKFGSSDRGPWPVTEMGPDKYLELFAFKEGTSAGDTLWANFTEDDGLWYWPSTEPSIHLGDWLRITVTGNAGNSAAAVAEDTDITCTADTDGSLGSKYFWIWSINGPYYVWYDIEGSSPDPAPTTYPGASAIRVIIDRDELVGDVASKSATAINAHADFTGSSAAAVLTVINAAKGAVQDATDGNTGFTPFAVQTQGTDPNRISVCINY